MKNITFQAVGAERHHFATTTSRNLAHSPKRVLILCLQWLYISILYTEYRDPKFLSVIYLLPADENAIIACGSEIGIPLI
ncbi:MAG: hypothetical protein IPI60_17440 [Saprospiraceae bacterium]|nr:hypothetical protein [Saprospiraceae bacterium]